MADLTITAVPYGTELTCMPLDWWQKTQAQIENEDTASTVIVGDVYGWYSRIVIEHLEVEDTTHYYDTYRVFTPILDEFATAETLTTRPIIIDGKRQIVTIGALTLELRKPKAIKLYYGRSGHLADDGAEMRPFTWSKSFATSEDLVRFLETDVLPIYSGEEGFFYRTEAVL